MPLKVGRGSLCPVLLSDNINWILDKMGAGEQGTEKKEDTKKGGALFHLLIVDIFAIFFGENLFVSIFCASAVV